eukprot:291682-Hanusia_phi.AAC.1
MLRDDSSSELLFGTFSQCFPGGRFVICLARGTCTRLRSRSAAAALGAAPDREHTPPMSTSHWHEA